MILDTIGVVWDRENNIVHALPCHWDVWCKEIKLSKAYLYGGDPDYTALKIIFKEKFDREAWDSKLTVNMKKLGITSEDLSRSRLTIQGFDQGTQRAIVMTWLDLTVGELKASTLFHYIKNGEIVKVDADMKPFTEAESYFADAKLYLDPDNMQEVLPSRFSVGYSSKEVHPKATPIENNNEKLSETAKDEAPTNRKHEVEKPPYSPVFRM
ncbi:UNVERIFIED_CONTAM: hypothetical protein Slati_3930300 [Sesamum latifolium]|uniref:Uncharacterized protein n=1 Tax=Sesamum latifolium TaxID=2727402 RepID=A0AAW2TNI5_9LAMI